MSTSPNIVLVHGAWADGSSWSAVIERLQADGYNVTAPQFPETSLADDVARLRHVLDLQDRPDRGRRPLLRRSDHDRARHRRAERRLGWSTSRPSDLTRANRSARCCSRDRPTPALAHLVIDDHGFAWVPEDDFVNHFAADIDPVKAKVMYAVQQPLAASTLGDVMGVPAWKSLPTWFLVADGDQAIPPDAERQFAKRMGATTVEVASNHVAMVSHPDDVVTLIETAAEAVAVPAEAVTV